MKPPEERLSKATGAFAPVIDDIRRILSREISKLDKRLELPDTTLEVQLEIMAALREHLDSAVKTAAQSIKFSTEAQSDSEGLFEELQGGKG